MVKKVHTNTKCRLCGESETGKRADGSPDWRRDKYKEGGWDRKSYLCTRCDGKERQKRPGSFSNIVKFLSKGRRGKYTIDDNIGKGIIGEAIIAKVRKLEIISIKLDSFQSKFDLSIDSEYNRIQSKLKLLNKSGWHISFGIYHYFDYLFILCTDKYMKNIEEIYVIPEKELYGRDKIYITKNYPTWKKFKIDKIPYNDAFHDLLSYIKDKNFGFRDIEKWVKSDYTSAMPMAQTRQ